MEWQLFHRIDDADSAAARRELGRLGLYERVKMRNVYYPEAAADLEAIGADRVPTLFNGTERHVGLPAVIAALQSIPLADRD